MPQLPSRRALLSLVRSGTVAVVILSAMSILNGCAERDGAAGADDPRAASPPSGQWLFENHCASCHGIEGRGDGPLASELRRAPANLRQLKQKNDGKFPSRRIQQSIDGRGMPKAHGLPQMPIWGTTWKRQGLTEAELRAQIISIANYIGTLQD